jgi:hypothetical protein
VRLLQEELRHLPPPDGPHPGDHLPFGRRPAVPVRPDDVHQGLLHDILGPILAPPTAESGADGSEQELPGGLEQPGEAVQVAAAGRFESGVEFSPPETTRG